MRRVIQTAAFGTIACLVFVSAGRADTKVTISETHLCCGQCLRAVAAALKDVGGVTPKCDQQAKTIELTAENDAAAQKAVDTLAAAGFYGKLNSDKVKYKPVDAPQGNVEKLQITGVHNCCAQCCTAIKKAVGAVEGVKSDTAKPREGSFAVEGNFKAADVVEALLKAGFYCQVQK